MPARRPTVLLCAGAPTSAAALVGALRARARLFVHAPPGARAVARGVVAVRGELGDAAAIRRWVDDAWAAARSVDAVVICPALPPSGARDGDWAASAAALRATFFLAQQAGLRLQRARRGQLILAIADQSAAGAAGAVLREGLICMAAGLDKALGERVAVAAVVATAPSGRRAAPGALGAAVAAQVAQAGAAQRAVVYVGGTPRRG